MSDYPTDFTLSADTLFALDELQATLNESYLRAHLSPPPRFRSVRLSNYRLDPYEPSQSTTHRALTHFTSALNEAISRRNGGMWRPMRWFSSPQRLQGVYLDGVFGVGKTHLLASLYHEIEGKKIYLSFTELMYLIGLWTLDKVAEEFSQCDLICIDEFELDDPGNTTMSLGFLERVIPKGVVVAATSNTPPHRLGEGRFDARNFQREIKEMASHFDILQIDGKDFRQVLVQESGGSASRWNSEGIEHAFREVKPTGRIKRNAQLSLTHLLERLRRFHPMHSVQVVEKLSALLLHEMECITHQYDALRFVYFIDKCYDHNVTLFCKGAIAPEALFPEEFFRTAYAKKYQRCLSRLKELCAVEG